MGNETPKRLRCAIYTRKSTEEGLEQAFNSLDAQREACASYILSQRHEGWTLLPDFYDDGGFTGGNMDRPGLKQLLADVRAGRVDVVVVYKVDRLTRALADFAKIVDVLDEAGASFVSVTQAFNTTSSMGRLTLNVLLSFAQFEREVISERIRDKVAASKARGMWMGGPVALGYRVEERTLVVVPAEADTVRHIMRRYLDSQNIFDLLDELGRDGIVSKTVKGRDGTIRGGVPFRRGALWRSRAPSRVSRFHFAVARWGTGTRHARSHRRSAVTATGRAARSFSPTPSARSLQTYSWRTASRNSRWINPVLAQTSNVRTAPRPSPSRRYQIRK